MEQRSTRGAGSTLISVAAQQALRSDTSLGCGNFLDRVLELSSAPDVDLLWVDVPVVLPDGRRHGSFSLATLQVARRTLAGWYSQRGVRDGEVVAVCMSSGFAPFLHYLALVSLGATPALINPEIPAGRMAEYIQRNGFSRLVSDTAVLNKTDLSRLLPSSCEVIDMLTQEEKEDFASFVPVSWPHTHEDWSLVMLSHTSGTTGLPKTVMFEHRQFFMGKRARLGQFAESVEERFLTALPQSHSSAISHLETAILHGVPTMVVGDPSGASVRRALASFQPTVVAGFPQTYASLVEGGVSENEFPSVRRWLSMGDAAHESHIRRLMAGSPRASFIDSFGSSELGMALFRKVTTSTESAPRRCIGRPVEIAVAKVLDIDSGEELAAGQVGLLAVRAPTITPGYWRIPEVTSRSWRGGYFLTGDVGFCREGEFYLIDRAVDVIASRSGARYTLYLEEELQQIEGVSDASVVGYSNDVATHQRVFALVLVERASLRASREIGRRSWSVLHHAVHPDDGSPTSGEVIVVVTHTPALFPLGPTGKVLKSELRTRIPELAKVLERSAQGAPEILFAMDGASEYRREQPASPQGEDGAVVA